MAMMDCKECGKPVSTKAYMCPNCGLTLRKKRGFFSYLGWGMLLLVGSCTALAVVGSQMKDRYPPNSASQSYTDTTPATTTVSEAPRAAYVEGATISIGYTSYSVWKSWWADRLSDNQFLDQRPNAKFLFIDLSVRNDDSKARTVPLFKLVDERGAEYEPHQSAWVLDGAISIMQELNPSVTTQGFVVFDVPPGRGYRLKLSGGYWSSDEAFVRLEPK